MPTPIAWTYPANLSKLYDEKLANVIYFTPAAFDPDLDDTTNLATNAFNDKETIALELPDEITMPEDHTWSSTDSFMYDSGQDAFQNIKARISKSFKGGIADLIASKVADVEPGSITKTLEYLEGKTFVNPHTLLVYESSRNRNLVFEFVFRPENEYEAEISNKIVKCFEWYSRSRPDKGGLRFPHVWKIKTSSNPLNYLFDMPQNTNAEYTIGENKFGEYSAPKIPFVCTNVMPTVNTNIMYHNEWPHQINLHIEFSEIKPKYNV